MRIRTLTCGNTATLPRYAVVCSTLLPFDRILWE
jgi:hypothetical protein